MTPEINTQEIKNEKCLSCTHATHGDCDRRYLGEDRYFHFPEDGCWEPKEVSNG